MKKIGWKTIRILNIQVFVRGLGPVSIAKIQRAEMPLPWEEINSLLKKERVFMCKFEPINITPYPPLNLRGGIKEGDILRQHGFKIDSWPLLGTKTIRVDLRQSEEDLLGSFKKDCRYILRKFLISNYLISKNNFDKFYEIWRKSARRKNLWIPGKDEYCALVESFGENCFCVTTDDVAGCVVLMHKNTAFYYYAGSTEKAMRENLPYLVVWVAMKEAKKRGCLVWDFEGVYDSRWPNKGWLGFSHFKKSFGGVEIEYPGCFTKWRWPG
jgi:hypothetical protein